MQKRCQNYKKISNYENVHLGISIHNFCLEFTNIDFMLLNIQFLLGRFEKKD